MNFQQFEKSVLNDSPDATLSPVLMALWHDAKGDWKASHDIVQDLETKEAAWIHAYLHRKEGDESNARYWYNRAGKKFTRESLSEERREIVEELLSHGSNNTND